MNRLDEHLSDSTRQSETGSNMTGPGETGVEMDSTLDEALDSGPVTLVQPFEISGISVLLPTGEVAGKATVTNDGSISMIFTEHDAPMVAGLLKENLLAFAVVIKGPAMPETASEEKN